MQKTKIPVGAREAMLNMGFSLMLLMAANVWDNRTNYRHGKQAYTETENLQFQQTPVICSYSSLC